jgi:ethanolamine utilization protein EutN
MHLGRVLGSVVATEKVAGLAGVRFLIVQPVDKTGRPEGETLVAADAVSMAGPGELIYYVSSREAAEALEQRFVPVDHAIVGIVDDVHLADVHLEEE